MSFKTQTSKFEVQFMHGLMDLRENPNEISEFCVQMNESYQAEDNTGIYQLSMIIETLLKSDVGQKEDQQNVSSEVKKKISKTL